MNVEGESVFERLAADPTWKRLGQVVSRFDVLLQQAVLYKLCRARSALKMFNFLVNAEVMSTKCAVRVVLSRAEFAVEIPSSKHISSVRWMI